MVRKIGLRIRRLRMDLKITQKDLARKVRISPSQLANFERGRRNISLERLIKIARALETPISWLLEESRPGARSVTHSELRLVQAYRKLADDPRLQSDLLRLMERMARRADRIRGRQGRGS